MLYIKISLVASLLFFSANAFALSPLSFNQTADNALTEEHENATPETTPQKGKTQNNYITELEEINFAINDDTQKQWVLYTGEWNEEKFQVAFPKKPKTIKDKKTSFTISSADAKSNLGYSLTITKHKSKKEFEEERKIDGDGELKFFLEIQKYLTKKLEQFENNFDVISFDRYTNENFQVLEIFVHRRDSKMYCKHTIFATSANYFSFTTNFRENTDEQHSQFVDSFLILPTPPQS